MPEGKALCITDIPKTAPDLVARQINDAYYIS